MHKLLLMYLLVVGTFFSVNAQQLINVSGDITTTTWTPNNQYLLRGYCYVIDGNTLTIEAGTVIKGDKGSKGALIIEKGAKIMAQGTVDNPIIFTSNQSFGSRSYGDWGGIIICGKAPVNWNGGDQIVEGGPRSHYGGGTSPDLHDNSGVLSYVRIEYSGMAYAPNYKLNGLSLYGVGDSTTIDHIQVCFSGNDSFGWFGGTVNAKYLVSYRAWDDDFDTDNGYSGKVQFGIALRDPLAADPSGSHGIESDSYQYGTANGLEDKNSATKCIFSNMTLVGPLGPNPINTNYDPQFVSGIQFRRGSAMSYCNSILLGWPVGILIDESSSSFGSTLANLQDSTSEFNNVVIAGTATGTLKKELFYVVDGERKNMTQTSTSIEADTITQIVCLPTNSTSVTPFTPYEGPYNWFQAKNHMNMINYSNGTSAKDAGLRLQSPFNLTNPDFTPTSTSQLAYNYKALPAYMTAGGVDPFKNGKVYPFDPAKPINTDTTNRFANFNAPSFAPDFSDSKLSDPFFTQVSYVGAIGIQESDNWTLGWTNFDPQNGCLSDICPTCDNPCPCYSPCFLGITNSAKTDLISIEVSPIPTSDEMTITYQLNNASNLEISIFDVTGNKVAEIFNSFSESEKNTLKFNCSNFKKGLYIIKISNDLTTKTIKVAIN